MSNHTLPKKNTTYHKYVQVKLIYTINIIYKYYGFFFNPTLEEYYCCEILSSFQTQNRCFFFKQQNPNCPLIT